MKSFGNPVPDNEGPPARSAVAKVLLACGAISSVLYIGTDILAANLWKGYSYTAQQVSELSAIGAPTRPLWIGMSIVYTVLVIAFAVGVWLSAGQKRTLRAAAVLLFVFGLVGSAWVLFAPMHARGTVQLATDMPHIAFAGVQVLVMVLFMALGSGTAGKGFRVYSIAAIGTMLVAGIVPSTQAQAIANGLPTPWMGAVERVSVYMPEIWIVVFALVLLRAISEKAAVRPGAPTRRRGSREVGRRATHAVGSPGSPALRAPRVTGRPIVADPHRMKSIL